MEKLGVASNVAGVEGKILFIRMCVSADDVSGGAVTAVQGKKKARRQGKLCGTLRARMVKTKMCRWAGHGKCGRGDSCFFAHDLNELRSCPDLRKTRICAEYEKKGVCLLDSHCRFAHTEAELRVFDGSNEFPHDAVYTADQEESPSYKKTDFDDDTSYKDSGDGEIIYKDLYLKKAFDVIITEEFSTNIEQEEIIHHDPLRHDLPLFGNESPTAGASGESLLPMDDAAQYRCQNFDSSLFDYDWFDNTDTMTSTTEEDEENLHLFSSSRNSQCPVDEGTEYIIPELVNAIERALASGLSPELLISFILSALNLSKENIFLYPA